MAHAQLPTRKKTTRRKKATTQKARASWERPRENGRFVAKQVEVIPVGPDAVGVGASATAQVEAAREVSPFIELGSTGLKHFSGVIDEEFLRALRGVRSTKVFNEMRENDPTVGAMLFAIEMLMRQVEWRVEPGGESPTDEDLATFVDECRVDMSETWEDTLASIFSFLVFGWSFHEIVYKRRDGFQPDDPGRNSSFEDGRIGWRKLPVRAQDTLNRWIFDPQTEELLGLVQLPPPSFTLRIIPIERGLLFRTTSAKGNPEGRSILRNAYRPWFFKRRIEEIEGVGVERDLAGLPTMTVPARILHKNAKPEERALADELRRMLGEVRRDEREGLLIPQEFDAQNNPLYEFILARSGGRRQFDTTNIIQRYERSIASTSLADFILLGQQRVGSYALADSKTELFGLALGAWLDSIAEIFNRHAIPRLLRINGIATDAPPKLVHGDVESIDLAALGTYITSLANAGMISHDEELENVLRSHASLPDAPEGAGPPTPPGPPQPPPRPDDEPEPGPTDVDPEPDDGDEE